ncbi:hypothetical protein [Halostagnicola bangensis]
MTPPELALLFSLLITILTLFGLPVLAVTEVDKMEKYSQSTSYSLRERVSSELTDKTSFGKHFRLCIVIIASPILPSIIASLVVIALGIQNPTVIVICTTLIVMPIVVFLFWLIDGYLVTLRNEILEDLPKAKQLFS